MKPVRTRWVCAALVLATAVYLALLISPILNPPKWDEYIVVYDAHRVAAGQVPYRDFFNFIPPGVFFFLAPLFLLSGASTITIARWAITGAVLATACVTGFALGRREWSLWSRCLWSLVFPIALFPWWAIVSHHWLACLCFAGELALLASSAPRQEWRLLAAGAVVGLCGLLVQVQGSVLTVLGLVLLAAGEPKRPKAVLIWLAGGAIVWVPFLGALAYLGALPAFFEDCVLWPARSYSRGANENAGPVLEDLSWRVQDIWARLGTHSGPGAWVISLAGILLYAVVVALGGTALVLAIFHLVRLIRRRRFEDPWIPAVIAAVFLWAGLGLKANMNWLHFLYFVAPTTILWLFALRGWEIWPAAGRRAARVLLGVLLVCGLVYHTRGLWVHWPDSWELLDADRPIREQPVNKFLRSPGVLAPGDTVAAFPEGGEVYLYTAPAAIRYTYFKALSQQYLTEEDHRLAAEDLRAKKPRWILLPPDLEADYLDERSEVAKVLKADYERTGIIGNAVLYRRKAQ